MVKFSAITIPALLALLATLSAAAPTPATGAEVAAFEPSVVARDVAPAETIEPDPVVEARDVEDADIVLETRTNHPDTWGTDGYRQTWNSKYNRYESVGPWTPSHDSNPSRIVIIFINFWAPNGYLYSYNWKSGSYYQTGQYRADLNKPQGGKYGNIYSLNGYQMTYNYGTKSYSQTSVYDSGRDKSYKYLSKRDLDTFEAPEVSEALETRESHNPYYTKTGYLMTYSNGRWNQGAYNYKHDTTLVIIIVWRGGYKYNYYPKLNKFDYTGEFQKGHPNTPGY